MDGEFVDGPVAGLRRPCAASIVEGQLESNDDRIAIAELEGGITLLNSDMDIIGHLGDDPHQSR